MKRFDAENEEEMEDDEFYSSHEKNNADQDSGDAYSNPYMRWPKTPQVVLIDEDPIIASKTFHFRRLDGRGSEPAD